MIMFFIVLIGLCFGSFINALVWRIKNKKNWVSDRSICVECKHILSPLDLIPVLSWLLLRGKCRYCKKPISIQYPIVEVICGLLFGLSYYFWPTTINTFSDYFIFSCWLIIIIGSLTLAVYDIKWMLLPNKILYPFIAVATVMVLTMSFTQNNGLHILRDAVIGVGVLFGFFYLIFQLSAGRWIGGGDVKLGILIGLVVGGVWPSLLVLFLSSLIATLFALPLMLTHKFTKTSKIPFGPFLLLAMFIVKLFGASIIAWYASKILLIN